MDKNISKYPCVSVDKNTTDGDKRRIFPSQLVKDVSGIMVVSDFINDTSGNVFQTVGDRMY